MQSQKSVQLIRTIKDTKEKQRFNDYNINWKWYYSFKFKIINEPLKLEVVKSKINTQHKEYKKSVGDSKV